MAIVLHSGAKAVTYDELRTVKTPDPTESHVPVPHHEIVELIRYTLGFYRHFVSEEVFAVTPDGMRFFGLLTLRSNYGNYTDTIGLRNSHDKSFPIGVAHGSKTFVCDNLAFIGDHVIKRKHTVKARRELPGLLQEIVAPLQEQRIAQNQKLIGYQQTPLTDAEADHAILNLYREEVIGVQAIAHVLKSYEEPEHDWGDRTIWRLFNAATFNMAGKVAETPLLTQKLHTVLDQLVH